MAASTVHFGYGDTQAYLAVPRSIADKVLAEGYRCSKRTQVPVYLAPDMRGPVVAMRQHHKQTQDTIVFEVHGVPEDMIDYENGKINAMHLDKKHIRKGICATRPSSHYAQTPCPICDEMIPDAADERGLVGLGRFVGNAFMVTPCTSPSCLEAQQLRQDRLDADTELTLYHQTSPANAKLIMDSGGKIIRGNGGAAGGGIYLAQSAKETEWKAMQHGVVLQCKMKAGKVKSIKQHNKNPIDQSFATLIKEGFDSVLIDRGPCASGPHKGQPSGYEHVAYSWDQVRVIGEVPRDQCT